MISFSPRDDSSFFFSPWIRINNPNASGPQTTPPHMLLAVLVGGFKAPVLGISVSNE